ncbi:DNA cytosine methyltransferase [Streptomyces monticola]|uniref:DNA (cytosine-5-)-methyltransferase n=1 Tax=Streptomyces monticola TaxID=2666263 RepID=A0ABW2JT15_9ACTN
MDNVEIVDLFAGPSGLDLAARGLGLPVVGIEWDASACATRRAAGLATVEGDVRDFGPADFPSATVLAGGPPTQTYTVAGNRAGRRALDEVRHLMSRMVDRKDITADLCKLDDERAGLVLEPLRWALAAMDSRRPYEAIVLEQVPAVLPVWEAIGEVLSKEGYSVVSGVLRAEEFGVPQTRRRAVLIARRQGEVELPQATHRRYRQGIPRTEGNSALLPWVSMGDVLDRPEPFVVVSNYGTGGDPRARGRRTSAEPAFTVTGKITRCRVQTEDGVDRFSVSEAGRLQGFPADYPWAGNDQSQQVGNAVPLPLATRILAAAVGPLNVTPLAGGAAPRREGIPSPDKPQ